MCVCSHPTKLFAGIISIAMLLVIIAVFWFLFWTYCLAPNPLVREFFDLDRKKPKEASNTGTKPTGSSEREPLLRRRHGTVPTQTATNAFVAAADAPIG